ncbi:helix-turn-helix transcriptional regulator [Streptomyces longisporus]
MSALPPELPPARRRFVEELRRPLEAQSRPLAELAEAVGISPSSMSRFFSGARLPSREQLTSLSDALNLRRGPRRDLEFHYLQALAEAEREGTEPSAVKLFASTLTSHVQAAGFTAKDVAAALHFTERVVYQMLSGQHLPSEGGLDRLRNFLGVYGEDREQLMSLYQQARAEEESRHEPPRRPAAAHLAERLKRLNESTGATSLDLAQRAGVPQGTVYEYLQGHRIPSWEALQLILEALDVDRDTGQELRRLRELATEEEHARERRLSLQRAMAAGEVLDKLLRGLKTESGLSLREITERVEESGIAVSKSTVDRILQDPAHSPQMSLQVAEVLIEELPRRRRGPVRAALFRALTVLEDTPPEDAVDSLVQEDPADPLVRRALSLDVLDSAQPSTEVDLLDLVTRGMYDDARLQEVLAGLTEVERKVVEAYAANEGATWREAAESIGVPNSASFAERVRRKLKRLAVEYQRRNEGAAP